MERPWNIVEQVIEDPSTKLRLEFSSVHTDEMDRGRPAPSHDQVLYLRLWTTDRTRVATYAFTRGGEFIKAEVESVGTVPDPGRSLIDAPHDAGQLVDPVRDFEEINYAKEFVGDI